MLTATNKYLIFSHFFKQPHTRSDDGVCDLKIVHDVKNAHNFFWLCKWSRLFIWKEINRWVVEEWVFVEIQIKFLNIQLNNFKWSKWPSAISHHSMIVYAKPFHTILPLPEPDPCISNNASYFAIHHQHANLECISAQLPLSAIYAFEVPPSVVYIIQLHFALDNNEKCSLMYVFFGKIKQRKILNITSFVRQRFLLSVDGVCVCSRE